MSLTADQTLAGQPEYGDAKHPFHITKEEERQLRLQGAEAAPSLVIGQATSFDEYARQLMQRGFSAA
ncbi:hypothetical protein [Streptomyces bluensis]|uniref:hypothetical protein n=1 Tax=Streptomyces bluensis TaxID=33897 RepID=UPI00331E9D68